MSDAGRVTAVRADLPALEAALAGDDALGPAIGAEVAPDWCGFPEALRWTRDAVASGEADPLWGTRFFVLDEPRVMVGWGGFKGAPVDGSVEIGYEIAPSFRGRGLATAAASSLVAEAFAAPGLTAVTAHTLAERNASNRVLEKLWFRNEAEIDDPDGGRVWRFRRTVPPQRVATPADAPAMQALMRQAILDLFPAFYDEQQTRSAAQHIAVLDMDLVHDATYFVHEAGGEIVACGGWSRRDKLYTGSGDQAGDARLLDPASEPARVRAMFTRADWTRRGIGRAILESCENAARAEGFTTLALMATLPGEQLYRAWGFEEKQRVMIPMPDGIELAGVAMERPVRPR